MCKCKETIRFDITDQVSYMAEAPEKPKFKANENQNLRK